MISEIVNSTYPWVNLRQAKVLEWIIYTIWDVEFTRPPYIEVVYRLLANEKQLFPTNRDVRETIKELSLKGILKCKMETFLSYDNKGILLTKSKHKILEVSDEFRKDCIKAMAYG